MAENIKIVTWNVNGIRASVKKGFYDVLKNFNADIFCVQETKAQDADVQKIAEEVPEYNLFVNSAEKKGYSGTAVFSKQVPLAIHKGIGIVEHDSEGRVLTLEYESFYLVNVYVPNSGSELKRLDYRKEWDNCFLTYIKNLDSKKPVVVTGDLNVAHQAIDLARPKQNYDKSAGYTQIEIDGMTSFIGAGFIDVFRHFNKDKIQYTFWNQRFKARENNVGWRIDYFIVSARFINNVRSSTICDQIMGSDHCPVELLVEI